MKQISEKEKDTIEEIDIHDIKKLNYHKVTDENAWKIELVKEITEIKNHQLSINEFSMEEITDILKNLCTS